MPARTRLHDRWLFDQVAMRRRTQVSISAESRSVLARIITVTSFPMVTEFGPYAAHRIIPSSIRWPRQRLGCDGASRWTPLLAVNEQAEGVACWIKHDAKARAVTVRWLMRRLGASTLEHQSNG